MCSRGATADCSRYLFNMKTRAFRCRYDGRGTLRSSGAREKPRQLRVGGCLVAVLLFQTNGTDDRHRELIAGDTHIKKTILRYRLFTFEMRFSLVRLGRVRSTERIFFAGEI